jgi:hypothetical protein
VLVIDTPENCLDCRFCYESDEGVEACCSISDDDKDTSLTKKIDCEYGYCQGKPDWCPLKPLPEKKEYVDPTSSAKAKKNIIAVGWNTCINMIVKGDSDD